MAYFTYPYGGYSALGIVATVILFLIFVRKSAENTDQLNYVNALITINENEIKASQHDFSNFDDGKSYINAAHPFSYDMDIFGKGSFFQFFNRTVTKKGEEALVIKLLNGIENPEQSAEAIDELTTKKEWFQGYLAHGSNLEKEATEISLTELSTQVFTAKPWINVFRWVLPFLAFSITALYYFSLIAGLEFVFGAVLILIPVRQKLKATNALHKSLSKVGKRVQAMRNQLTNMEKETFTSDLLKNYATVLFHQEKNAKQGLSELSKLVKEAEFRDNVLVAVVLNFFLAWDLRLIWNFKKWQNNYASEVENWEEIVYQMEALISGANFRYNFKSHTGIPTLYNETNGEIELTALGHPIIPLKKLVTNNFSLAASEQFAIVTGPNMAGKSTFLRSIGVNLMLARAGFHVMAKKFTFPNMKLYSSMRTSDDLKDETSYFHAELLRLRFIVDAIERKEKVFIILDEILKGTNSKDKEEGSAKFLQKLNQLEARGIIATHDLSLTQLANVYTSIVNKYFDTTIAGDEISFDYCIRNGVAQNMNASFLLRKMGLIDS
ncbi:DNA mismatch repair protein MutS [Brumimicrobium salinarum]|uniref:DNA mismatch repair protein MutS n=1 Tax=Brumimicrobium salinarum TaxID=2058658 RepID=A0A2I0R057_9FLAO|nr:DNA mismatch repair protein MutS [Brumimicrobium salinarum]